VNPAGPGAGHGPDPGAPRAGPPGEAGLAAVTDNLRAFLASATGRDELLHLPPGTALFGEAVGLDSLTGTLLLREIQRRFGVDVAGEDLNLDSLATLGTLAAFVAQRAGPGARP
jgi:acyl carrier protein